MPAMAAVLSPEEDAEGASTVALEVTVTPVQMTEVPTEVNRI